MSSPAQFFIRPVNAVDAVRGILSAVADTYPDAPLNINVTTNVGEPHHQSNGIEAKAALGNEQMQAFLLLLESAPFVVIRFVTVDGFAGMNLRYDFEPEKLVASFKLNGGDHNQRLRYFAALSKHFTLSTKTAVLEESLPEIVKDRLAAGQQVAAELAIEVGRLGQFLTEQMQTQSEFLNEKVVALDKAFQEKQQRLDDEHRTRSDNLTTREAEHAKRVAEQDARAATVVRRKLLEDIQKKIEARKTIALSDLTGKKRRAIHILCIATLFLSAGLAGTFAYRLYGMSQLDWHVVPPLSAGLLLFASTLIYYIKWSDHWFREHAQAEFRDMRFTADILRASWVAEFLFEWEKERQRDVPEVVIASFTRNLFRDERWRDTDHPAEAVPKLLSGVGSLKVNKDGVEIVQKPDKKA